MRPSAVVCFACIAAGIQIASPAPAASPAYPTKPIRLVIPQAAGGNTDLVGRMFAEQGAEAIESSPQHFREFIARDVPQWKKVLQGFAIGG